MADSTALGVMPVTVRRPTVGTSTCPRSFTGRSPDCSGLIHTRWRITSPGSTSHCDAPCVSGCTDGGTGIAGMHAANATVASSATYRTAPREARAHSSRRGGAKDTVIVRSGGDSCRRRKRLEGEGSKRAPQNQDGWGGLGEKEENRP